jgi:hypothetical protein
MRAWTYLTARRPHAHDAYRPISHYASPSCDMPPVETARCRVSRETSSSCVAIRCALYWVCGNDFDEQAYRERSIVYCCAPGPSSILRDFSWTKPLKPHRLRRRTSTVLVDLLGTTGQSFSVRDMLLHPSEVSPLEDYAAAR